MQSGSKESGHVESGHVEGEPKGAWKGEEKHASEQVCADHISTHGEHAMNHQVWCALSNGICRALCCLQSMQGLIEMPVGARKWPRAPSASSAAEISSGEFVGFQ